MHLVARELRSQLTGEDAVDRARLNLRTKGRDDFFSRERLASALRHAGHIEEAVAEYAWCAGQAVEAKTLAAKSRRSKLFAAITDFARENPAADNLLNGILDDAETSLLKEKDDPLLARDLTQIYQKSKKARAKTFFNQLDKESRARHGLLDLLFDDLVAEGRYQEVLKLIDPLEAFKGEVKRYQRNRILRPALAEHGKGRGTRSFVIQRSLALTQALAETGETAKASTLMKNLLEFDNRETTQQALRESLGKAGRLDLIQE